MAIKFLKNQSQPASPASQTVSSPVVSIEVNAVQSSKSPGTKKKGRKNPKNMRINNQIIRHKIQMSNLEIRESKNSLASYVEVTNSPKNVLSMKRLVNF